jgi:hypothetical protein
MLKVAIFIDTNLLIMLAEDSPSQQWFVGVRAVDRSYANTQFQTPRWCAAYMASLIPPDCRTVLEPTPGAGNLVAALSDREVTAPAGDFWQEIAPLHLWFDCVVMNPPFSPPSIGYQILLRCMEMTNHIIALMPWLTIINAVHRTKLILDYGLVSVTHLPRSTFPGTRVQCCVLQLSRGFSGVTALRFV